MMMAMVLMTKKMMKIMKTTNMMTKVMMGANQSNAALLPIVCPQTTTEQKMKKKDQVGS